MDYKLKIPTPFSSAFSLERVAIELATSAATLCRTHSFHEPTYLALLPGHKTDLLTAARSGRLIVCNLRGAIGTAVEIIEAEKNAVDSPVENRDTDSDEAHLCILCTTVKCLNDWGQYTGNTFALVDVPVDVIDFDLLDADRKVFEAGYFRGTVGRPDQIVRPDSTFEANENLSAEAPQSGLDTSTGRPITNVSGGRPKEIGKKAEVIRKLIAIMTAGKKIDSTALPGSPADLLDACERIAKSKPDKAISFKVTEETFKTWLNAAGYRWV